MSDQVIVNNQIPINYAIPGIYMALQYTGGAPAAVPNKRVVLLAYHTAGSIGKEGQVYSVLQQSDTDGYSGNRGSDLSRLYAATIAQLQIGSGVTIDVVPVDEPAGGVQATHLTWFRAPQVQGGTTVDTNTAAAAPGIITDWVCGFPVAVGVQQGDNWNTIAANFLLAAQPYAAYLPATPAIVGETLTWGTGTSAFSITALQSPVSIVVTQLTGNSQTATASYASGLLSIALGTNSGGTPNTTGTALVTLLGSVTPSLATVVTYSGGSGVVGTLAQTLLPFACVCWTMRHKGDTGNWFPQRLEFSNTAMRVGVAFAKLTFSGSAAATPGTESLQIHQWAFNYTPAASASASTVAAAFAAAGDALSYPVTFASDGGANVWLYFAPKRVVHRLTVSTVDSSQSIIVTDRVTSGALATMTASVGFPTTLQGQGYPVLTAALAALASRPPYVAWAHPFLDAGSLGAISQHIEQYQMSPSDKGQTAHVTATDGLLVSGAIPTSSSPLLTASPRYAVSWCPGAWEQPWEIAGRCAALVAQLVDFPPKNYDGQPLIPGQYAPLHVPDNVELPDISDLQVAITTYYLTPITGDTSGNLAILTDRTTWQPGDLRLTRWGGILTMDADRVSLKSWLAPVVKGKNIKVNVAYTQNCVTTANILKSVQSWMIEQDKLDIYDGAQSLFPLLVGAGNPTNPQRYDLQLPMTWPQPLSVVGITGIMAQPST